MAYKIKVPFSLENVNVLRTSVRQDGSIEVDLDNGEILCLVGTSPSDDEYINYGTSLQKDLTEVKRLFGINIRARMAELNMNQRELAYRSGITPPNVSRYVNGLSSPGLYVLKKFAKVLECPIEDLIPD